MTEEKSISSEQMIHIKTLFSRLTELVMSTCVSRRGVADALVAVGNWAGVIFASLIVMVEDKSTESNIRADQITNALNREIKKHIVILRGIKKNKEKSRIIVPKGTIRD